MNPKKIRFLCASVIFAAFLASPASQASTRCGLLGAGTFQNSSYNFRVTVGGEVQDASDYLNNVLDAIQDFKRAGLCATYPVSALSLHGAGKYNGSRWNFRVKIGANTVFGTDYFNNALNMMTLLRQHRLAFPPVTMPCTLSGEGTYNNSNYRYRLSVDGRIIFASDYRANVLNTLGALRNAGVCR